eukprot:1143894-Pelagomonas_calceolata.AAC.16
MEEDDGDDDSGDAGAGAGDDGGGGGGGGDGDDEPSGRKKGGKGSASSRVLPASFTTSGPPALRQRPTTERIPLLEALLSRELDPSGGVWAKH